MDIITGILFIVIIILIVVLILRQNKPSTEVTVPSEDIEKAMKDQLAMSQLKLENTISKQFIEFQTAIHKEMTDTKKQLEESKNMMNKQGMATLKNIKEMDEHIHKIVQQQQKAEDLGQSLKDLLQTPKLRGNYGEVILEEMLEKILPVGIWESQYIFEGGEKVDAVVKIKDVIVPIDAKFPRDDYMRYLEAETDIEKQAHWKSYETTLKRQIRNIGSKYVKPGSGTSDFALMFIPSEAIYYETIAEKNCIGEPCKLYEYAQENKVIPVSPNTFYAFLQIVILGVRNIEIIEGAKKLQENLVNVQVSFDKFYAKYQVIGKQIHNASEAYRIGNDHIVRFKTRVDGTLKLETFKDVDENSKPSLIEAVDLGVEEE